MNYDLLADMLLPDINKTPEYYYKLYPKRKLKAGARVTRYAPSPTGYQHLGGVFAALIYERIAHQSGGVFFLRIEDTDKKREVDGGIEDAITALKHFNIHFDEGMTSSDSEKGSYGPYKQSSRIAIYKTFVKYLIKNGLAYPCFCSEEDLARTRKLQEDLKIRTGYFGKWAFHRNADLESIKKELEAGKSYVIRLKSPGDPDKRICVKDLIRGNIEMPENDQDIVLLKSDGLPTYHLAHAVDDFLMDTTNVIRGEEWLPSTPLHLQLFDVLGFTPPNYAHIPTLMKMDGTSKRKLSKRKDPEISIAYYKNQGYPVTSVIEYLLTLINSSYEDWRRENPNNLNPDFKITFENISQAGPLFDVIKLSDISKKIIADMTSVEVYRLYLTWAEEYDNELFEFLKVDTDYSIKLFNIGRNSEKPRKDFAKWLDVRENIDYFFDPLYEKNKTNGLEFPDNIKLEEMKRILTAYITVYSEKDDKETWFSKLQDLSEALGYSKDVKSYKRNPEAYKGKISDVASVIRIALTTKKNTPDLYEIMQVMGQDRVLKRLKCNALDTNF